MSQKIQIVCDNCGRIKQKSNNWFNLYIWEESKHFASFPIMTSKNIDPKDFCGQECLISEIHRIINLPSESK